MSAQVLDAAERLFSNLYMYHSKLQDTKDYEPLAIGYNNQFFPFLFCMLETYDRDRIRRGVEDGQELELADWMKECDFIQEYIVETLEKNSLKESLDKVITFYIRKWKNQMRVVASKMEMERVYIIDDLYEITETILGLYQFVHELQANMAPNTKFSCEFCIGVYSTRQEELTHSISPNEEDRGNEEPFVHKDLIGDFVLNMKDNGIPHHHVAIEDRTKFVQYLHGAFAEFKKKVESGKYKVSTNVARYLIN